MFLNFFGADDASLQPVGLRPAVPPMQIGKALLAISDFDAAHLVKSRPLLGVQTHQQFNGILSELAHHLRAVGLEDQPRCMRCRSARFVKRPFIDDDDITPAQFREMIGRTGAHNPSTDNDYIRLLSHTFSLTRTVLHLLLPNSGDHLSRNSSLAGFRVRAGFCAMEYPASFSSQACSCFDGQLDATWGSPDAPVWH